MIGRGAQTAVLIVGMAMAGALETGYGLIGVVDAQAVSAMRDEPSVGQPTRAERLFAEGLEFADANRIDAAVAVFSRLTREYPHLRQPHEQLAALYARQNNFQKAAQSLQKALELQTDATLQRQTRLLCEQQDHSPQLTGAPDLPCPSQLEPAVPESSGNDRND